MENRLKIYALWRLPERRQGSERLHVCLKKVSIRFSQDVEKGLSMGHEQCPVLWRRFLSEKRQDVKMLGGGVI